MSFILDALKKLEREKEAREPGVVMVGPVPWGERDRRRRGPVLAVAGAVLAAAFGVAFLWLGSGPEPPRGGDDGGGTAVPSARTAPAPPVAEPVSESGKIPPPLAPNDGGARSVEAGAPPPRETTPPPTREAPLVIPVDDERTSPEEAAPVPAATPPSEPEYRLTAISSRDGQPIALLNDRLVREGDSFDGITVVAIGETSVEIEVDGKRRTIGF